MSRLLAALGAVTLAGSLSLVGMAPAAVGKEGVRARLVTPVPLAAAPGAKVTIVWTLSYDDRGHRRRFGAGGVFVRLLSASGGRSVDSLDTRGRRGRYSARVRVPRGGIGGIRIGLEGTRYSKGRAEQADIFFPIVNSPFKTPRATGSSSTPR